MQAQTPEVSAEKATTPRYDTIVIRGCTGKSVPKEVDGGEVVAWSAGHELAAMGALEEFVDYLAAGNRNQHNNLTSEAAAALNLMHRRRAIGWAADEPASVGDAQEQLQVSEALMKQEPSWTRAKPTQPGAYWIRGNQLMEPALVQVKNDGGQLWCNLHISTTEPDFGYGYSIAQLSDQFEWIGPLGSAPAFQAYEPPVGKNDPLYQDALQAVVSSQRASASMVQRRLGIGYNRAARMVEAMEAAGIVSGMNSDGACAVLVLEVPNE